MTMKKLMKFTTGAIVAALSMSSWAQNCTSVQPEQLQALLVLVTTNKVQTVNSLLNKYCYDPEIYKKNDMLPPFYFANSVDMLKLFENRKIDIMDYQEKSTGLDLFSYFLIEPFDPKVISDEEKQKFTQLGKKYDSSVTKEQLNEGLKLTHDERDNLLFEVGQIYKNGYVQRKDIYGNTALSYVIMTGESSLMGDALGSYSTGAPLFRKNKEGLAPVHLVFGMNYIYAKDEAQKKKMMEATNDAVLKLLDSGRVGLAGYKDMSFFDFAEMMKDENPDFYNKLKDKFHFVLKSNPKTYTEYRKAVLDNMKYPQRMKKISDDK